MSREQESEYIVIESSKSLLQNNALTHVALDLACCFLNKDSSHVNEEFNDSANHRRTENIPFDPNVKRVTGKSFPLLRANELDLLKGDFQNILSTATNFAREETGRCGKDVALVFVAKSNSILLVYDYHRSLWAIFDGLPHPLHEKPAVLLARSGPTLEYLCEAFGQIPKDPKQSRIFTVVLADDEEDFDRELSPEPRPSSHDSDDDASPHPFLPHRSGDGKGQSKHRGQGHGHHKRAFCHEGADHRPRLHPSQDAHPFHAPGAVRGRQHARQPQVPSRFVAKPRPVARPPAAPIGLDLGQIEYVRYLEGQVSEMKKRSESQSCPPAKEPPAPAPTPSPTPTPTPSSEAATTQTPPSPSPSPCPPKPLVVPTPVAPPNTFECSICFERQRMDDIFIAENCKHACCRTCASDHIMASINTTCVVPCFENGCTKSLTQIDAQIVLNDENMKKYWMAEKRVASQQKDTFVCPKPDCPGYAVVEDPDVKFYCIECSSTKCVRCDVSPFHENLTCDQFMAWKRENDNGDNSFEEFLSKEKHIKCPGCKVIITKDIGCNKMTCKCGICICYLCNTLLDHDDPHAHFKANGGSDCDLFDIPKDLD